MSDPERRRAWLRPAVIAGLVGIVMDLPGLLTGALAVPIMQEFAFGTAGLGLAIGATRGAAALSSIHVGRLVDRLGSVNSLRIATVLAVIASAGIAFVAQGWGTLTFFLALSGVALSTGHPAANRLLSILVPPRRQGVAFGIKQSSPPMASLLAGLSVPLVAATLGWRWAFGLGALLALSMLVLIGKRPKVRPQAVARSAGEGSELSPRFMLAIGLAFGLGTGAAVVVPGFFVDAAVRAGTPVGRAGVVLAVASVATILMRLSLGFLADRLVSGHFRLCASLVAIGAGGLLLIGSNRPTLMAAGAIIAMAHLWGFNGVFWYAVVRVGADSPGTITGAVSPGGHLGGSLGPILFGIIAASATYRTAWLAFFVVAVGASAMMLVVSRLLSRGRPLPA
jgi:MFS family permease